MRVGVINMYPSSGAEFIIKALDKLGHSSFLLKGDQFSKEELFARIKKSPIKNWIFSGSTLHIHEGGPQVPLDILKLEKRFLLICYSMESLITRICKCEHQLKERYTHKNEIFHLRRPLESAWLFDGIKEDMVLRRNHHWYLPSGLLPVYEIASYRGELMIAGYKNCLMMQFHPEKTTDGLKMIANWLGFSPKKIE
jgi:GMP synthase-like glutamine amidotransferase